MKSAHPRNTSERRHYIRLDSVFPVRLRILDIGDKKPLSEWIQGFTNNISIGGICLAVHSLAPEIVTRAKNRQMYCALEIEIPLGGRLVHALGRVAWFQDKTTQYGNYLIGLTYEEIGPKENNLIVRHARLRQMFVPSALLALCILTAGFLVAGYFTAQLSRGNRTLAARLASAVQSYNTMRQTSDGINRQSGLLRGRIDTLEERLQALEGQKKKTQIQKEAIRHLNAIIRRYAQERELLREKLTLLQNTEGRVAAEMARLDKKKSALEKANLEKMYRWLCVHQNPRTGLVMSFEGDTAVADWAFSYDQSLAGQSYLLYGDHSRAKKILEFFNAKAKRVDGLFLNAYYCREGDPAEEIAHAGPTIWVGILALQYTAKTQDSAYLGLAKEIAQAVVAMQQSDPGGGVKGGPTVSWYSTEHNLDAYAFFGMLYALTGNQAYRDAQDTTLKWLLVHAYDRPDIPIKRGKGDSTIATDTYGWSIASLGPGKLVTLDMNPDEIISFVEKNCGVEVDYKRPEGTVMRLKGFDFAAQRNVARGGVISAEWTAQMVIAYKIMADFYAKKNVPSRTRFYADKAEEYLSTLSSMLISSPSPSGQGNSCLPYASEELADTGHGWSTPRGRSTGSVAATAYALCAYHGYNPLELNPNVKIAK